ncbi:MAG: winged helix-turn-helix domain-containing protein [Gammaproteobacteria bacterium]
MSYLSDIEQKYIGARETIEQQNRRIGELEAALAKALSVPQIPPQLRLTPTEAKVLEALLARAEATKEAILLHLYSTRCDDAPEIKIVDVLVFRIRKKLARHGLKIETRWGRGYALPPETRAGLDRMVKAAVRTTIGAAA